MITAFRDLFRPPSSAFRRTAAVLFLAVFLPGGLGPAEAAPAGTPGAVSLTTADKADIRRIETYLNGIRTMTSRFLQVSSDGTYSEGDLYFFRPGKMRLDYDDPKPIELVSDGVNLAYYDKELEQVSYYGLDSTQAAILLKDNISFSSGEVIVTSFERGPGVLRLTVIKGDEPFEGNLTLIFSDAPLELKKWAVTDAQGVTTNVSLLGARFGMPLAPGLFKLREPIDTSQ